MDIALGTVQLADTGFTLAKALYQYADGVNSSQKQIRSLGNEVENTAKVLRQVNLQLDIGQQGRLYSEEGRATAYSALEGCRQTFNDLKLFLHGVVKYRPDGSVCVRTRAKWPLKTAELERSRQALERWKSTLHLSLMVVLLKQNASSDSAIAGILRIQIGELLRRTQSTDTNVGEKITKSGAPDRSLQDLSLLHPAHSKTEPTPMPQDAALCTSSSDPACRGASRAEVSCATDLHIDESLLQNRGIPQAVVAQKVTIENDDPGTITTNPEIGRGSSTIRDSESSRPASNSPSPSPSLPQSSHETSASLAVTDRVSQDLLQYSQSAVELVSGIEQAMHEWQKLRQLDLPVTSELTDLVQLRSEILAISYSRHLQVLNKQYDNEPEESLSHTAQIQKPASNRATSQDERAFSNGCRLQGIKVTSQGPPPAQSAYFQNRSYNKAFNYPHLPMPPLSYDVSKPVSARRSGRRDVRDAQPHVTAPKGSESEISSYNFESEFQQRESPRERRRERRESLRGHPQVRLQTYSSTDPKEYSADNLDTDRTARAVVHARHSAPTVKQHSTRRQSVSTTASSRNTKATTPSSTSDYSKAIVEDTRGRRVVYLSKEQQADLIERHQRQKLDDSKQEQERLANMRFNAASDYQREMSGDGNSYELSAANIKTLNRRSQSDASAVRNRSDESYTPMSPYGKDYRGPKHSDEDTSGDDRPSIQSKRAKETLGLGTPAKADLDRPELRISSKKRSVRFGAEDVTDDSPGSAERQEVDEVALEQDPVDELLQRWTV